MGAEPDAPAGHDEPVGKRGVWLTIAPVCPQPRAARTRVLDEAHPSGGDLRRLAGLFGLSIQASQHYTAIEHLEFTDHAST